MTNPNIFPAPAAEEYLTPDIYKPATTETDAIVENLTRDQDLDKVSAMFSRRQSQVRDIAGYTEERRAAVLSHGRVWFGERRWFQETPTQVDAILRANAVFQNAMQSRGDDKPPLVGKRFTESMHGFLQANMPWAVHIDPIVRTTIESEYGRKLPKGGVENLLEGSNPTQIDEFSRYIWEIVSKNNPNDMAWCLAERSQYSENWQRDRYAKEMTQGKRAIGPLIKSLALHFELPQRETERALLQLRQADFSAFDHLLPQIRREGAKIQGDYTAGTLRIELKNDGTIFDPKRQSDPQRIVNHELLHASSAQTIPSTSWRLGLQTGAYGLDPNEGMTELLTKLSVGAVEQESDGSYVFNNGNNGHSSAYGSQTRAMFTLLSTQPETFGVLFRAYYGFVSDAATLTDALKEFYLYNTSFHDSIKV